MKNSWETVTVDNNPMGLYLSQPDGAGPFPAIIVIQNQDGVAEIHARNDPARRRGRLCRHRAAALPSRGRTQNSRGNRQLQKYPPRHQRHQTTSTRRSICCAAAPMPTTSKLGIVGFCMGGRIAFLMAAAATRSFKAAVDFYGGGTYSTMGRPARAGGPGRQRLLPGPRPLRRARQKSAARRDAPARRRAHQVGQSASVLFLCRRAARF